MTTTTQSASRAPGPAGRPDHTADRLSRQTSRFLHRLHFFAGIICGPFILVAAVTGLLYAAAPTLEQVVYHDMLTASATAEHPAAEPVSRQVATARAEHPDLRLAGVRLGKPDETTRVLFTDPELPESTLRAVFIDPYSGAITGDTTQYGSSGALPFRHWLSTGHRSLWLGDTGRLYSELAASWLGVLAVGGLVMWWQRQRKGSPGSRVKAMLRTMGRGRTRTMRRHGATGTLVAVGMIFLTVTGLTWSSVAGSQIGDWRTGLSWTKPTVTTSLPGMPDAASATGAHADHGGHAMTSGAPRISGLNAGAVDRVADTARAQFEAPFTITPPTGEGAAWSAAENRTAFRFTLDAVAIDWATGTVTDRVDFADWPLAAKLTEWLINLHMGLLLGWISQLILFLLAAAIIAMVWWGYAMWWKRRPRDHGGHGGHGGHGARGSLPTPPQRAGRGRPTADTLVLGAVLVVYGVIAPLFGISCLAFILLSVLWGAGRRGRTMSAAQDSQVTA